MKKFLPIIILISTYLIFKASNVGIRLSDTNIYFLTGQKLLEGQILYRDIFFTNFPLLPYLSSLYFVLLGGSIKLFFLTPALEVSGISLLIYKIVLREHKGRSLAIATSLIYLFSFIILSTSDHQSGVFFASLASIASYYFYLNKKYILAGVFIALALLTKAYFLPILITFFTVFLFNRQWKGLLRFIVGGALISFAVMLPTFIFAFPDFIKDVFQYSLTRSQGVGKSNLVWFFITNDFLIFILFLFSLFNFVRNKFLGLISSFGILFFIFYQDIYYLYLNFLAPFLVLSFPDFYKTLQMKFNLQKAVILTFIIPLVLYGVVVYWGGFRNLQKLNDYQGIVDIIKKENPSTLYGVNDITPILSYSSDVPLLNDIIDTNANIYRKGILNAEQMTKDAIAQNAIIVTHGMYYPQSGIEESVTDEIFNLELVKKNCELIKGFPVQTEGAENRLNLLRCF